MAVLEPNKSQTQQPHESNNRKGHKGIFGCVSFFLRVPLFWLCRLSMQASGAPHCAPRLTKPIDGHAPPVRPARVRREIPRRSKAKKSRAPARRASRARQLAHSASRSSRPKLARREGATRKSREVGARARPLVPEAGTLRVLLLFLFFAGPDQETSISKCPPFGAPWALVFAEYKRETLFFLAYALHCSLLALLLDLCICVFKSTKPNTCAGNVRTTQGNVPDKKAKNNIRIRTRCFGHHDLTAPKKEIPGHARLAP